MRCDRFSSSRAAVIGVAALIFGTAGAGGCERQVRVKGGIESALKESGQSGGDWDGLLSVGEDPKDRELTDQEAASLRRTDPDGTVTLISRSPAHVMYHLTQTLRNREYDLLLDQVLSDATKQEYRKRAIDPMQAVQFLARRQPDIQALFATMPIGDQTPGVMMEPIGPNRFRLSPPSAIAYELKLREFDVIIERREFRLLMIR